VNEGASACSKGVVGMNTVRSDFESECEWEEGRLFHSGFAQPDCAWFLKNLSYPRLSSLECGLLELVLFLFRFSFPSRTLFVLGKIYFIQWVNS